MCRYVESANILSKETNLDMTRYDVCDNIDLETVIMEYESYYFVRFQKYPKIIKKLTESGKYIESRGVSPIPINWILIISNCIIAICFIDLLAIC